MSDTKLPLNAIIIDDEPANRSLLTGLLGRFCPQVAVIGEAGDIQVGLELILERKPNLLFLDICMPDGNGFELLDQLIEIGSETATIFTTAFDNYAVRAFRYSALDYLLKPIHPAQLKQSVKRFERQKEREWQLKSMKHAVNILGNPDEDIMSIIIRSTSGHTKVNIADIIHCEADGNYTTLNLQNGNSIVASKSLKEFDKMLAQYNFLRVHQSHLINMEMFSQYVRNKDAGGGNVVLKNGTKVPVSRNRKKNLMVQIRQKQAI